MLDSVAALAIYEGKIALVLVKQPYLADGESEDYARLVGGKIDTQETPFGAALRYVNAAFGIVPRAIYFAGIVRTLRKNRRYIFVMDGVQPDDIIPGSEISEVVWQDIRTIPPDWPNYRAILAALMLSDVR